MREQYVIRFDLDISDVADAIGTEGIELLGVGTSRRQETAPSWMEYLDLYQVPA